MKTKATKRQEAAERQAARNTRTWAQQLAKLNEGDHVATKERRKLVAEAFRAYNSDDPDKFAAHVVTEVAKAEGLAA